MNNMKSKLNPMQTAQLDFLRNDLKRIGSKSWAVDELIRYRKQNLGGERNIKKLLNILADEGMISFFIEPSYGQMRIKLNGVTEKGGDDA